MNCSRYVKSKKPNPGKDYGYYVFEILRKLFLLMLLKKITLKGNYFGNYPVTPGFGNSTIKRRVLQREFLIAEFIKNS